MTTRNPDENCQPPVGLAESWRLVSPPTLPSSTEPDQTASENGGFPLAGETCGSCAWSGLRGPGRRVPRCLAADGARIELGWAACPRWEPALDCLRCGACCGPAFDAVEVSRRDPVRRAAPELLEVHDGRLGVRRTPDNRCVALTPGSLLCRIYADRPRCCRDFTLGSANCLFARRRVGLSRSWSGPPPTSRG